MKIAVVHDYADVFRRTPAFARLSAHEVIASTEASPDPALLVAVARGCEALVLTQQRGPALNDGRAGLGARPGLAAAPAA